MAEPAPLPRLALSIDEAAEALGIGRASVYRLIQIGDLRPVKLLSRTVVPMTELQRLLSAPPAPATEAAA